MSTTTSNLELFKYTNEDSAEVFNFEKALNENWDKIDVAVGNKQETLVSGTNIKTINNTSILGNGNIDTSELFIATYGTTTYADVVSAITNGKKPCCIYTINDITYLTTGWVYTGNVVNFELVDNQSELLLQVSSSGWTIISRGLEATSNKVTSISSSSTDAQYPSAKLLYDQLALKQATLNSGTNIKTINGNSILGSGNIVIESGSNIDVDDTLSTTSTNPVQNKVITTELNKKIEGITSNNVITALGYTPYNSTNPNGYTSVTSTTVSNWGFTKNTGTVKSVNNTYPDANGNVTVSGGSSNIYVSGTTLIIS